ncbi:hypothetical protein PUNSTDRAFT_136801 [Punctularia strigosozonata HHB-11173 SS5]|uniref:uncharacterized protein n=1 Tax=Punctularia strigosozonata (strain HHB-11173) TaxID=741275 RepID=UPI0004416DEB|nr:uncharacterized protein PUNSTDRAFT_136801 [Punctularia strigosozonata HHB-11173 SS5]EIN06004.1 hypothetical protein PUNSTDRAFT_136801 [Punctularia strigosozonata HHB-11173 SS5]
MPTSASMAPTASKYTEIARITNASGFHNLPEEHQLSLAAGNWVTFSAQFLNELGCIFLRDYLDEVDAPPCPSVDEALADVSLATIRWVFWHNDGLVKSLLWMNRALRLHHQAVGDKLKAKIWIGLFGTTFSPGPDQTASGTIASIRADACRLFEAGLPTTVKDIVNIVCINALSANFPNILANVTHNLASRKVPTSEIEHSILDRQKPGTLVNAVRAQSTPSHAKATVSGNGKKYARRHNHTFLNYWCKVCEATPCAKKDQPSAVPVARHSEPIKSANSSQGASPAVQAHAAVMQGQDGKFYTFTKVPSIPNLGTSMPTPSFAATAAISDWPTSVAFATTPNVPFLLDIDAGSWSDVDFGSCKFTANVVHTTSVHWLQATAVDTNPIPPARKMSANDHRLANIGANLAASHKFILDTGANISLTKYRHLFESLHPLHVAIGSFKGSKVFSSGVGTMHIALPGG